MNDNFIKILALICSLIFINRILVITPDSLFIYYGSFALVFLLLLFTKKIKISIIFLLLSFGIFLSIAFNNVPEFYQPYFRLLSFIIIIALFSSFIRSKSFDLFRLQFLNYALKLIILLVIVSFILLVTNIIPLSYPYNGITVHSMILGPLAAFTLLFSVYRILLKKGNNLSLYSLVIISFIMILVSSSRGTLLSLILSFIFLLYKINWQLKKKRLTKLIYFLLIFLIFYPFWGQFIEGLQIKFTNNINRGSIISSRETMWLDRLDEFNSSPIFGIGFASMKRDVFFINDKNQIELGSSYLGALSMTGLFGFFSLLLIIYKYVYRIIVSKNVNTFFISSILIFLLIHMIFEGYIFGSGNSLMLLFWLLIGISPVILEKKDGYNNFIYD